MVISNFIGNFGRGLVKRIKSPPNKGYSTLGLSFFDVKLLKHLPAGKLRKRKFLNNEIFFYDPFEFLYGVKEIFVNEIYKQELGTKPYIIDCGSHIGLSVIYLKRKFPDAVIVGFEPDGINFELLTKNLAAQKIDDVDIRKKAVWVHNNGISFSSGNSMSSKISLNEEVIGQEVESVRLKDLLYCEVGFLKMDIEGAEYTVLEDIQGALHFVKNIFIEYHGTFDSQKELFQILSWLEESRFEIYIQEAARIFTHPLYKKERNSDSFDIQLNIYGTKRA